MDGKEYSEAELVKHSAAILDGKGKVPGPAPSPREQLLALAVYATCLARAYWPDEIPAQVRA